MSGCSKPTLSYIILNAESNYWISFTSSVSLSNNGCLMQDVMWRRDGIKAREEEETGLVAGVKYGNKSNYEYAISSVTISYVVKLNIYWVPSSPQLVENPKSNQLNSKKKRKNITFTCLYYIFDGQRRSQIKHMSTCRVQLKSTATWH